MDKNTSLGKLIAIGGTDGSGKATQTKLLLERLQKEEIKATSLSFPQYGKKSAGLVEEYLAGSYGKPNDVNPYAASLFYALDRFDISSEIQRLLELGFTIILDRYVESNAGHQGGKIADDKERDKFLQWLYKTEYGILEIPKPDLVIILRVSTEICQKLMHGEKRTKDGHETDFNHLKNAERAYLWLAKKFPEDHVIIECVENGEILPPEEIGKIVWKHAVKILTRSSLININQPSA